MSNDFGTAEILGLAGVLLGMVLGAVIRATRFCTACAVRDVVRSRDYTNARMFAATLALAIAGTQWLHLTGRLDLRESIYWGAGLDWFGAVSGGLVFGVGMAMVGTCAFSTLTRTAGGDLRGLFDAMVIGITGYATLAGIFAEPRIAGSELATPVAGPLAETPDLVSLLNGFAGTDLRVAVAILLPAVLLIWAWRGAAFRRNRAKQLGAIVVGITVPVAWLTTATLGADPFDPQPLSGVTYVSGISEALVYAMTFTGAVPSFGIGLAFGTLAGAALTARLRGEMRLEAFADAREMRRHLIGAALMGAGGVTALGCTLGQGLTGVSTLALSSLLALASIWTGAAIGQRWLDGQTFLAAVGSTLFARR